MKPVLTREEMRALDAHAITACRVPSLVLMENAGRGASDVIEARVFHGRVTGRRVVVVAGVGNNGGDGFVIARRLVSRGASVHVFVVGDPSRMSQDARTNHDAWIGIGGPVSVYQASAHDVLEREVASADAIVDALFGTGLDRPIAGDAAVVIEAINRASCPRVAIDIPSGLDANTGKILGHVVMADMTITLGHPKPGLLTGGGKERTGALVVVDIGIPRALGLPDVCRLHALESDDVAAWLQPRALDVHKFTAGHVAIFAGSLGKTGASLLVGDAALRAGAGAATIATWPDAYAALASQVKEIMTARLDVSDLTASIDKILEGKRAVIIGPGFGLTAEARHVVAHVLAQFAGPIVLDADALTLFAGELAAFRSAKGGVVLTPHAGELARLLGRASAEIEADRIASARDAAKQSGATCLLKGPGTLVARPDGACVINTSGGPALATAGSGDVLAGILGALLCSLEPFEAACAAAFVHGRAGETWPSDRGMLAGDISAAAGRLVGELTVARRPMLSPA